MVARADAVTLRERFTDEGYAELCRLAAGFLRREPADPLLSPPATAKRDWRRAKRWLRTRLGGGGPGRPPGRRGVAAKAHEMRYE